MVIKTPVESPLPDMGADAAEAPATAAAVVDTTAAAAAVADTAAPATAAAALPDDDDAAAATAAPAAPAADATSPEDVSPPPSPPASPTGPLTLAALLQKCGINFEAIKGTSRRSVLCTHLAKQAGIECDAAQIEAWELQWDQLKTQGDAAAGGGAGGAAEEGVGPLAPTAAVAGGAAAGGGAGGASDEDGDAMSEESRQKEREHRKVFVGGLPSEVTETDLIEIFSRLGGVSDADVKRDSKNGRSRGFGFVIFNQASDAAKASDMKELMVKGKRVEVQLAVPTGDPSLLAPRGLDPNCKVFVGGLVQEVTEQHLRQFFSSFGSIAATEIKRDHSNGRSRGFGFVTFHSPQAAEDARRAPPVEICGRQVEVLESMVRGDPALVSVQRGPDPRRKVFVGGLPQTLTEVMLKGVFEQFGDVTHAEIKRDFSNDRSRGFGFVIFADERGVEAVLQANVATGIIINGRQVEVQPTLRKGDPQLDARQSQAARQSAQPSLLSLAVKNDGGGGGGGGGFKRGADHAAQGGDSLAALVGGGGQQQHGGGGGRGGHKQFQQQQQQQQRGGQQQQQQQQQQMRQQMPLGAQPQQPLPPASNDASSGKVFVGNLSPDITPEDLVSTFSLCGDIVSVDLKKDSQGRPKNFAFVTFADPTSASRALAVKNPLVGSRHVTVRLPTSRRTQTGPVPAGGAGGVGVGGAGAMGAKRADGGFGGAGPVPDVGQAAAATLFVGNLALNVDSIALIEEMSVYGPVQNADVQCDPHTGLSRGYGYVVFREYQTAEAVAALPKWSVHVRGSPVDIRRAAHTAPLALPGVANTLLSLAGGPGNAAGTAAGGQGANAFAAGRMHMLPPQPAFGAGGNGRGGAGGGVGGGGGGAGGQMIHGGNGHFTPNALGLTDLYSLLPTTLPASPLQ